MIAAYFLVVFWFIPLQIIMAVMAHRIARSKGLNRPGEAFLSALFFGYPAFVAVCEAKPEKAGHVFSSPLAAKLLEFTLIVVGSAWAMLALLLFSFVIPGKFGDYVGEWALGNLAVWSILCSFAIPIVTIWLRKQSKIHGPMTWKSYAIAIGGQAIAMLVLFNDFTIGDDGLTEKENAILRNLLIPCAIPLFMSFTLAAIGADILAITALIQHFTTGVQDSPNIVFGISATVALVSASAVSPLICYDMARKKHRSTSLWAPLGFVLPVIAPLALLVAKAPVDAEQSSQDDWLSAMLIQSQIGFAVMIATFWMSEFNVQFPESIRPWAFAAFSTWMCFNLMAPFAATHVLKVLPKGTSPIRLAARTSGIHCVSMTVALVMTFIKSWMHSPLL